MEKMSKDEVKREIFSYLKVIFFSVTITWLVCSKIVTQAQVPTGSMENTVETGSRVIVNRIAYLLEDPQRGDIIAFRLPDDESQLYLKRIVALPGEVIESREGKVYVDGVELAEPYVRELCYMDFGPYTVPQDSYFMMGDNRNNSWDSRYWKQKYVERSAIVGKAVFEFYPEVKVLE